jgi:ABC-type nitrate/sulfonate/bicarbonate transport system substrate-binding protein
MRKALLLLTILALLPVAGVAQAPAALRLTTTYIDSGAEPFYAQELGIFQKYGLNVQLIPGKNGSAMVASVASNSADIGYSDVGALSKAYSKGIKLVAVAPAALWTDAAPVNQLIVEKNSTIRTGKDLNGKVLGVPGLATGAEYAARAWVDKNGGDANSVKFIELPYPAMAPALEAGRIDAAYVAEPFLTPAKKSGRLLAYADDAIAKVNLRTVWFATPEWTAAHPDIVKRFAAAMRETAAIWANDKRNQAKSAEILVKYAEIDPATVATMIRAAYGVQLTPALVQPQIDITAHYNNFAAFPAKELIASGLP